MNRDERLSILVVDDQPDMPAVYEALLRTRLGHELECTRLAGEAIHHTRTVLFDVAIVDAKIRYKGAVFGGLILADEIRDILGTRSIVLLSQDSAKEDVAAFGPAHAFLPKPAAGSDMLRWAERELMGRIRDLVRRQYGFVAMPYNDADADRWYHDVLVPWMNDAGFSVKRMDEIPATGALNQKLQERIRDAHFVVVSAPYHNPNVFFEAGFTAALEKYMVLFAPNSDRLPFDVRANHFFPFSESTDEQAKGKFLQFMAELRGL